MKMRSTLFFGKKCGVDPAGMVAGKSVSSSSSSVSRATEGTMRSKENFGMKVDPHGDGGRIRTFFSYKIIFRV